MNENDNNKKKKLCGAYSNNHACHYREIFFLNIILNFIKLYHFYKKNCYAIIFYLKFEYKYINTLDKS